MAFGLRIRNFITKCYATEINFAEHIGIDYTSLSRYISERRTPNLKIQLKFQEAGMSIDWMLNGTGSMFANNDRGKELKSVAENYLKDSRNEYCSLIINWINENYENLENYSKTTNFDYDELFSILFEGLLPSSEMIAGLRLAGCSVNWLITGEGSKYENNPAGIILKMRNDYTNKLIKTESLLKSLHINALEDLYELIKYAVKSELEQNERNNNKILKNIFGA